MARRDDWRGISRERLRGKARYSKLWAESGLADLLWWDLAGLGAILGANACRLQQESRTLAANPARTKVQYGVLY